jgi:hypothetical protein
MNNEKVTIYTKERNEWRKSLEICDPLEIYQRLASDLIAKKINACLYIKKIERGNLYNGTQKIIIYYDNGVKAVYIVKN